MKYIKQFINWLKGLFSKKETPVIETPTPAPTPVKVPAITTTISQVPEAQKGSVTDKLFGISPEEKARRDAAVAGPGQVRTYPVLSTGSTLGPAGQVHVADFKAGVPLTVTLNYTGWASIGIYECAGSVDGTSFHMELGAISGSCGNKAGHVVVQGPGLLTIFSNQDTTQHVVWQKATKPK